MQAYNWSVTFYYPSKKHMNTKSNRSNKLDTIENLIWPKLQSMKYRKSKRIFNRIQPDGIVHVINFQMGPNWSTLQGKFTIEIGVFVPEVYEVIWEKSAPKYAASPDCEERTRLGSLVKNEEDLWWDLSEDERIIQNQILDLLLKYGEQYFLQFSSREKLITTWEKEMHQKSFSERKKLIVAIILASTGETKRANEFLEMEFGGRYKTVFLEYARNIASRIGLDFPTLK